MSSISWWNRSSRGVGGTARTLPRRLRGMESFEQFVAVAMESEGLIVSEAIKFPVARQTKKAAYPEIQTHGYEVDLVGARSDRLVLATVKSFFGSRGVVAEHVMGTSSTARWNNLYLLLNDKQIRKS